MQIRRFTTWKYLALFGLAGPPIGALAILLWSHSVGEPPLRFNPRVWLLITFPAAYLYAGVPALVTGCSAALARKLAPRPTADACVLRFAVPALVGAGASVLFSLATIASEPSASFAAAGAFAALVCTTLMEWRARLRPNSSFKPKPLRGSA